MGTKKNVTLAIDEELLDQARVLAARRRTSVTKLIRAHLRALVLGDEEFEKRRARLRSRVKKAPIEVGDRWWTRDELHER